MVWVRRHGKNVQGRGVAPHQDSQGRFEQGLPCLKSGWTRGAKGELLPVSPSSISHLLPFLSKFWDAFLNP